MLKLGRYSKSATEIFDLTINLKDVLRAKKDTYSSHDIVVYNDSLGISADLDIYKNEYADDKIFLHIGGGGRDDNRSQKYVLTISLNTFNGLLLQNIVEIIVN